ncbi:MAG: hypothetical protein O3A10_13395 [Chloroflexi bacterium]|nr:hypothetical protein [Chloroflexota bacterium]MDA1147364.1 hypothetical protein [Chloroflexota bacterium]
MTTTWRSIPVAILALAVIAAGSVFAGTTDAVGASVGGATGTLQDAGEQDSNYGWWRRGDAVGQLYQLQAAFHAAATLREPNNLDERIADMLTLWTNDAPLTLGPNTFVGKGEPGTASCAPGAGTLCDFFTNVAPPFQNRWISLSPSYKTEIEVHGNTASLDFQCLYFDEAWAPAARLAVDSTATRVRGDWKFSSAVVTPIAAPGIPYP